jgi:hypothetical protein
MVLLLLPLFATAAGAIYIEGQAPPDDGQPHILMAESGQALAPTPDTDGPIKRYLSDDPNDYVLVPGNDPDMMYALDTPVSIEAPQTMPSTGVDLSDSISLVSTGFPAMISSAYSGAESYIPPAMSAIGQLMPSYGLANDAIMNIPAADSYGNINMGSVIGHMTTPPAPGYWDNIDPSSLMTNMPAISFPGLFA